MTDDTETTLTDATPPAGPSTETAAGPSTETPAGPSTETPARPSTETAAGPRSARKVREGVVVSNGMDKTAVVAVIQRVPHPKYNKFVMQTKRLYVHDEDNDANVGDRVRVMETRPLSKTKRWRIVEILERAR